MGSNTDGVSTVGSKSIGSRVVLSSISFSSSSYQLRGGGTYASPVVPERNHSRAPLVSSVDLLGGNNHVVEVGHDSITLHLRDSNDSSDESGRVEQGLPSSNRVDTNQRVLSSDGVTTNRAAESAGSSRLLLSRVLGGESLEVLLHMRREKVVGGVLGRPEGITSGTTGRSAEDLEGGVRRRLNLVGDIGVP